MHILQDLKEFLDNSPTSFHATEEIANRLATLDFIPLNEEDKWELEKGKSYFVQRNGSIAAFTLPKKTPSHASILAAHTDSPALKLKPNPKIQKENMTLFGVEVYGAPLLSSWLNRDLAIAGKIVVLSNNGTEEEKLVFLEDAPLIIPGLAIHFDKEVNEKGLILNKQDHLSPIVGLDNHNLEDLIRRYHSFHTLLAFDLFAIPLEQSRFIGANAEMIASYRIDNLLSAHACATAIAKASRDSLNIAFLWDHEEIGSRSTSGANSPFLEEILKRIAQAYSMNEEDLIRLKASSLAISVDMAHALNPNYITKHDPQHQPLLGKGIVIKYNADQKYASDAKTASHIMLLCKNLSIPYQQYVTRSDTSCGSTVGPIIASTHGIPTVDIGCPQLSMHSIREIASTQDYVHLVELLTESLK